MLNILKLSATIILSNFDVYLTPKNIQDLKEAIEDISEEHVKLVNKINTISALVDLENFDKTYYVFHAFLSVRDFCYEIMPLLQIINQQLEESHLHPSVFTETSGQGGNLIELQKFYDLIKKYNVYLEKPLSTHELQHYQNVLDKTNKLLNDIQLQCDFFQANPEDKIFFIRNLLQSYEQLSQCFDQIEQLLRISMGFVKVEGQL